MAYFKKLSMSKRILAIALSVMLLAMSIPVGTMLSVLAETSGDISETTLTIAYDSTDPVNTGDIVQWLIDQTIIATASDLDDITELIITGDLDADAFAIIDEVNVGTPLTDVSVTTSADLDESWLSVSTVLTGSVNFNITMDSAKITLLDGEPEITSLTLNGGTLDISDVINLATFVGIANLSAIDSGIVFPAGTLQAAMEQFLVDVNADLGGTVTGTPQGGSLITLTEATVNSVIASPDSFKNAATATPVTVTINGEHLTGQTIVVAAAGANAVTSQNAAVAADGNSATATLTIPANTTNSNQVYTISVTVGGTPAGSGATATVIESVKPTVDSITTYKTNAREGTLSITFSENMNTMINGSVTIGGPALGSGSWAGRVYSVSYSGLPTNTGYSVSVNGFEDVNGNAITAETTAGSFTTVNNAALLAAIVDAKAILQPTGTPGVYDNNNKEALYTDSAFNQLIAKYEAAIAVPMTADQDDINNATTALNDAISALNSAPGMGSLTITWNAEVPYAGKSIVPCCPELGLSIKNGSTRLVIGTDYIVDKFVGDTKNVTGNDIDGIDIVISGINDYAATAPIIKTFKVVPVGITVTPTSGAWKYFGQGNIVRYGTSAPITPPKYYASYTIDGLAANTPIGPETDPETPDFEIDGNSIGSVPYLTSRVAGEGTGLYKILKSTFGIRTHGPFDKNNYALNFTTDVNFEIKQYPPLGVSVSASVDGKSDTGWFNIDNPTVTLTAPTTPEAFHVSVNHTFVAPSAFAGNWYSNIDITPFGIDYTNKTQSYWLKNVSGGNDDGAIFQPSDAAFKIDREAPKNLTVDYSTTLLNAVLETITFGFYNGPIEVTLTADNVTSPINYFVIYNTPNGSANASSNPIATTPANIIDDGSNTIKIPSSSLTNEGENKRSYTFTISPQYRGQISFMVVNEAGNAAKSTDPTNKENAQNDGYVTVVDTISPKARITYEKDSATVVQAVDWETNRSNVAVGSESVDTRYIYNGSFTATISIEDENFDLWNATPYYPTVTKDGAPFTLSNSNYDPSGWEQVGSDVWENTISFEAEGDYKIHISYSDRSNNPVVSGTDEKPYDWENNVYVSRVHTIDMTAPVIDEIKWVQVDNGQNGSHRNIFNQERTATITVTDRSFRPSDFDLSGLTTEDDVFKIVVKGKDGNPDLTVANASELDSALADWKYWENTSGNALSEKWEAEIVFTNDDVYTAFNLDCVDIVDNPAATTKSAEAFTIDKADPIDLKIEYGDATLVDSLLEVITFGFYKAPVKVTLTATDLTSNIDYFKVKSTLDHPSASDSPLNTTLPGIATADGATVTPTVNPDIATYSFVLSPQYRGYITFVAFDNAGNSTASDDDSYKTPGKNDNIVKFIVVDDISPDSTIEFTNNTWADEVDASNNTKTPVAGSDRFVSVGEITAKITIKESNFDLRVRDPDAFIVSMTRNNAAFTGFVFDDNAWTETATDTFVNNTLKIPAPTDHSGDGDYVINISFKDRSDNNADWTVDNEYEGNGGESLYTYTSNILTIDTTAPVIVTDYAPTSSMASGLPHEGIFDAEKSIKITVTDRDFRPSSIKLSEFVLSAISPTKTNSGEAVVRYTVAGQALANETVLIAELQKWSSWNKTTASLNGSAEVWETTIIFNADGEYSFKLDAKDIAGNAATQCSVPNFIVDKTAPSKLKIKYDSDPFRDFISLVTFNLFKSETLVTIIAEDITSGIEFIEWIYAGDSGLHNSTAVDVKSDAGQKVATRISGTDNYTVSFKIPGQFRGDVTATAVDFAGNRSNPDPVTDSIEIVDSKDPIINVTYPGDVAPSVFNGVDYFKADRTARVEITEDNFVDSTTQIIITRDGQPYSTIIPSSWTSNGTSHVKQFVFNEDGDYTFEVICKDIVGRESKVVEKSFTLDKTIPVFEIVYNNNDVRNGNYYKAERMATLTITEHNFNAPDVNITVGATDDGTTIAAPRESAWSTNGDVHTATIHYSADARYTFAIAYTDLAGNAAAPFTPEEFYVDKTAPEITIENVSNRTAYGDVIQPNIKLYDVNYGEYTVTMRRTDVNADSANFYAKLNKTVTNNADGKGATINFANIPTELENDGIYNLSIILIDKAGNETPKAITFSVNRFGSTYYFADEATRALADKTDGKLYINKEINIKIGEINVDPLAESAVTVSRNNDVVNELKDGSDYTVTPANEPSGWYACVYDIKASNFANEGFYTVIVTSTDTAEHTSKNTIPVAKGNELPVEFTVDKTKPDLTIKNIEGGIAYSETERKVTIESTDVNLNPESLKVYLDGNEVAIDSQKLVTDQFGKLSIELTIKANDGKSQTLEAKISDLADNETENSVKRFTLSANIFQLWFQNKPLFILSLIGILGLSGGLFFLLWKRRKKDKVEA